MLQQESQYNDLSDQLRSELETQIKSFGKRVRLRFNISHQNPDPTKYNGDVIWPFLWTLDPAIFSIVDPYEKRTGKQKSKQIAMVERMDEKGVPNKFQRIRVQARFQGELPFDLENIEDQRQVMYALLHPKLTGGKFADKNKQQIFSFIDEKKEALAAKEVRNAKRLAYIAASGMTESKLKEFAAAMGWDEHGDIDVLQNMVEALAESTPELFVDLVEGKSIEFRAMVKRAIDTQLIAYNPTENKFIWVGNQETITVLGMGLDGKNEIERLAEWLMTAGKQGDAVYKKLKSLEKVNITG